MSENEAAVDESEPEAEGASEGSSDAVETESTEPQAATSPGPDENELIKEWAIYLAGLFGVAGVAGGLFAFVATSVDRQIFTLSAGTGAFSQQILQSVVGAWASGVVNAVVFVAVVAAVFVGVHVGQSLAVPDDLALKIAGAGGAAGGVALFVLGVFLVVTAESNVSANLGGVIINGVLAGVAAGAAGAGGAWLSRNQAPDADAASVGAGSPAGSGD